MPRSDVWLSLEQVQYRLDVLRGAEWEIKYAPLQGTERPTQSSNTLPEVIRWAALHTVRKATAAFLDAERDATRLGGAAVASEFADLFTSMHRVASIRKHGSDGKAARKKLRAEYAAKWGA